jgi:hypothetical protein
MKPNDQYYSMKSTDRGLAVIFSHESYDEIDGTKPAPRHGTSIDVEKLSCTFSDLGFTIDVQEDKTYEEIIDRISQGTSVTVCFSYMTETFIMLGISAFLVEKPGVPMKIFMFLQSLRASVNSRNCFLPYPHPVTIPTYNLFLMNCM